MITINKPLTLKGIGTISSGSKVDFSTHILPRGRRMVNHINIYKDQVEYDSNNPIEGTILEIPQKDNLTTELTEEQGSLLSSQSVHESVVNHLIEKSNGYFTIEDFVIEI